MINFDGKLVGIGVVFVNDRKQDFEVKTDICRRNMQQLLAFLFGRYDPGIREENFVLDAKDLRKLVVRFEDGSSVEIEIKTGLCFSKVCWLYNLIMQSWDHWSEKEITLEAVNA